MDLLVVSELFDAYPMTLTTSRSFISSPLTFRLIAILRFSPSVSALVEN